MFCLKIKLILTTFVNKATSPVTFKAKLVKMNLVKIGGYTKELEVRSEPIGTCRQINGNLVKIYFRKRFIFKYTTNVQSI